jgi:hypothetical protein
LRKSEIIDRGSNSLTRVGVEGDDFIVHRRFFDDGALDTNRKIRNEIEHAKMKLGLHDNADVLGSFSVPSLDQWNLYRKNNPDVYALLHSKQEHERRRGLLRVYADRPEWFLTKRAI